MTPAPSKLPIVSSFVVTLASILCFSALRGDGVFSQASVDRTNLRVANVTAEYLPPFPSSTQLHPVLKVTFKNVGQETARLERAEAVADFSASDCSMYLLAKERSNLNRDLPPNYEQAIYFPVAVDAPCSKSLVLKLDVVYRNLDNGDEYQKFIYTSTHVHFDYPAIEE